LCSLISVLAAEWQKALLLVSQFFKKEKISSFFPGYSNVSVFAREENNPIRSLWIACAWEFGFSLWPMAMPQPGLPLTPASCGTHARLTHGQLLHQTLLLCLGWVPSLFAPLSLSVALPGFSTFPTPHDEIDQHFGFLDQRLHTLLGFKRPWLSTFLVFSVTYSKKCTCLVTGTLCIPSLKAIVTWIHGPLIGLELLLAIRSPPSRIQ
jgi:hypothetical protein